MDFTKKLINKLLNKKIMQKGEVLSELQFYKVDKVNTNGSVVVISDDGQSITLGKAYVNKMLSSAASFSETVKLTRTELIQKFLSSPRMAMTVNFNKQVKEADIKKAIVELYPNRGGKLMSEADFKKKVSKALNLKGEERTMVGRHYSNQDDNGRVHFIDMNIEKVSGKDYDTRSRLVDPRTLNWLIVDDVKYEVK